MINLIEKIKKILSILVPILIIVGIFILILYVISLKNQIKQIKLDVIDSQLALRDSIVAEVQKENKARIDTFWIKQETIKYYEKRAKDYEDYIMDLGLDSLILEYWRTRPNH